MAIDLKKKFNSVTQYFLWVVFNGMPPIKTEFKHDEDFGPNARTDYFEGIGEVTMEVIPAHKKPLAKEWTPIQYLTKIKPDTK